MSGEKISPRSSDDGKVAAAARSRYVDLDEQRRAALAEIDNAAFSCVYSAYLSSFASSLPLVTGGSISVFVWSPVLVSSPMRE